MTYAAVIGLLALALAPGALAGTFPGRNGRIAYTQTVSGKPQIFTMDANGRGVTQVTREPNGASNPDWSADGRSLAFDVGGTSIGVSDPNGGGVHLIGADANLTDPSWSRDGSELVTTGIQYGPQGNVEDESVYLLHADGGGDQRIEDGNAPVWSPDGSWFLYTPTPATNDFCGGVYAERPDGSDHHGIAPSYSDTGGGCTGGGSQASFSPDGRRVVFVAPNGRDLETASVHGGPPRRLRSDPSPKSTPIYSPDGRSILFVTGGPRPATAIVSAKRGGRERVIGPPVTEPAWQPLR